MAKRSRPGRRSSCSITRATGTRARSSARGSLMLPPARTTTSGLGGGGPHYCMGASLARAQLTAIFGEMLRVIPDIESGEPELLRSASIHAIKRMPCSSPHGPDRVIAEALARGEATRVRRDAQAAGWVTSCSSVPSGCCSCRALRTSPPSRLSIAPDERPSRCPAA